jgi:peptidoglycan/xylan/chitin deacetylase (PgdA/CDA1 family)
MDDAEETTLKLILEKNLDIPVVIGIPAGLIGKKFEDKTIASKELIIDVIRNLNVEIASHSYYHDPPSYDLQRGLKTFFSRMRAFPDKSGYFLRALEFLKNKNWISKNLEFDIFKEIVVSKRTLEKEFMTNVITFLYPGGYFSKDMLNLVKQNYNFARTSEIGINNIADMRHNPEKFLLKTISTSKYTNFSKIERYYKDFLKKEDENKEFIVIETYHILSKFKSKDLYGHLYGDFEKHYKHLKEVGSICKFSNFMRNKKWMGSL